jgi:hypothetical protein
MIRQNIGSRRSKVLRYWEWGLGIRPRGGKDSVDYWTNNWLISLRMMVPIMDNRSKNEWRNLISPIKQECSSSTDRQHVQKLNIGVENTCF